MRKTYVDFEVYDLNLNKFIARLQSLNIGVIKLRRPTHKLLKLRVSINDYEIIIKDEKLSTFNIILKKRVGIKQILISIASGIGAVLGSALSFLMFYLSVQKVTNINVVKDANHVCGNGEECIFKESNMHELESYLEAIGLCAGVDKNQLNIREIERKIIAKFDTISACTIEKMGTKINLKVFEAELSDSYKTTSGINIIAPENMKITKMIVSRGKANVKAGDIAKKGQVLVSGVDGKKAMATIEGVLYYRSSMSYAESKNQLVRTGNKKSYSYLSFMGHEILNSGIEHGYNCFESETQSRYTSFNHFLPIKVVTTTFYELENRVVETPFEDVKNDLLSELRKQAENKIVGDVPESYQARFVVTNLENGLYLLDCYLEIFTIINV